MRYGHWLVGLNAHPTRSYEVKMPVGFTSAVDLASGTAYTGNVTIGPRSYVVFHLPSATEAAVSPANPLMPVALATGGGSVAIGWEPTAAARGYVVSRSESADGPFTAVSGTVTGTSWMHAGASGGFYRVQAIDAKGNRSGFSPVVAPSMAASVANALQGDWLGADIGGASAVGTSTVLGNTVTVASGGHDVWGTADGFHYVYQPLAGNGQITVRVASQTLPSVWSRAGLMVRTALASGSPHASLFVSGGDHGAEFSWRPTTNNLTQRRFLAGYAAPTWLRLTRQGGEVTGEVSTDGQTWARVWRSTINLPPLVYVGLAVTSSANDRSNATFDSLTIQSVP